MFRPSGMETALLVVLLAGSLYGFWRRFGPVLRNILGSRTDPDFRLSSLGKRVRVFVSEVMFQTKVIRERPLPGIAHAFVFWGFCAFALVTIDHIGTGLGAPLLDRSRSFGRVYFATAALFAVAVSVSIAGLAARRFLSQPRWLGRVSPESGVIALLIFVLMITYLADYTHWLGPGWVRPIWWMHTAALLVFLPLIPHTKHLHLMLSPVAVFLERDGFSKIPPLEGDEDFGLDTGKDITKITALQAYSCVECGRCTEHCPAYNTGKVLNPKQIILGVRGYLNEYGTGAEAPLIGTHISQEAAYQCTTCGACEYQCPVGIQHLPVIIGLRRGATNTGKWEDEYGTKLFLNLERNGNSLGMSVAERDRFIKKHELPVYDGTQEYCLWMGCMGSYDPQGREIILSLAQVLNHLGITYGVLAKERCSGDPARRLGNDLAFQQLAESNMEALRAAGVKKLVSICPHCVRTIENDWREFGGDFEIEHHSQLLARHQARLPENKSGNRVVFHDPCYLGRYRNIYDAPREVIARSAEVIEPHRARQRSFCCGAGGGLAFLGEEKGKRVSVERAEELTATGAEVVGAACPFCNTMFRDALSAISPSPPKLLDIAQIAAASIRQGSQD
ncbi:MAG: 4Fe-4S dicluster domain-containing protein [Bryobacteraceae bacterium]|nr:4Fe-4S dicluster domain-containing protein [Bryobacteraceae bacterium]